MSLSKLRLCHCCENTYFKDPFFKITVLMHNKSCKFILLEMIWQVFNTPPLTKSFEQKVWNQHSSFFDGTSQAFLGLLGELSSLIFLKTVVSENSSFPTSIKFLWHFLTLTHFSNSSPPNAYTYKYTATKSPAIPAQNSIYQWNPCCWQPWQNYICLCSL